MVGTKVKDFILKDQFGKDFRLLDNLSQVLILVFYPKDETPTCTKQLCEYNNNLENFQKLGFKIIGISVDDNISHQNFAGKYNFHFPILSDVNKNVSRQFHALSITGMSKRKIIVIDKSGIIRFVNQRFPLFYFKTKNLLNVLEGLSDK